MSSLPFPYNQPTSSQSQVRQKAKLFISPIKCGLSGSATLSRNSKGNWLGVAAVSATSIFAADIGQLLREYSSALINYKSNPKNAAISINSLSVVYSIATVAATSVTLGLSQSVVNPANNIFAVTDLIVPATVPAVIANNMTTATLNSPNPATLIVDPSLVIAEVTFVLPANSSTFFYGFILDFNISR